MCEDIDFHSLEQIQNYSNQELALFDLLRGSPSNPYGHNLKLSQEAMEYLIAKLLNNR